MLRVVFARTLKPGVTYEQFRDAWTPERADGEYPARASISRNVTDERQVITILELDMTMDRFAVIAPSLTRLDALDRVSELVESTELQGIYEEVFGPETFR
ncbi:MAG TPA: hypothetical protein VKV80_00150 [Streptosporangiaceae bacterium]|nr:hypothetical protein [Streptosporangiaceae bacterium]